MRNWRPLTEQELLAFEREHHGDPYMTLGPSKEERPSWQSALEHAFQPKWCSSLPDVGSSVQPTTPSCLHRVLSDPALTVGRRHAQ